MSEGEFKKQLAEKFKKEIPFKVAMAQVDTDNHAIVWKIPVDIIGKIVDEVRKEFPKVSQKWVPTKGSYVDWKTLCLQMEQKIIEFENFGKRWFGCAEK